MSFRARLGVRIHTVNKTIWTLDYGGAVLPRSVFLKFVWTYMLTVFLSEAGFIALMFPASG